jgi:hypothetical protein
MFEHVKKRKIAQQKQKKKIKKIKINNNNNVVVNSNFVENLNEVFACSVIIDFVNVFVLFNVFRFNDHHYYIDFKIDRHLNEHKKIFTNLVKLNHFVTMINFNDKNIVSQQNTLKIKIFIYERFQIIVIRDVLFVLDFSFSLLSVKIFERKDLRIIFDEKKCQIMRKNIQ